MNNRFKYSVVSISAVLVALLLVGAMLGQSPETSPADPYKHINVFTEVFAKIKGDYVEEPDMKNVTLGAINGLLVSMDPFASYLNAEQYKQYLKTKENPKAGVGLVMSRKYGYEIGVVDAVPGSPADKAGLSTGDIIEAINGISTRDMPLAYAEVLLHGEPGSTVELTILRLRKPEPVKISLTRSVIAAPPLESKMLDPETGYIAVEDLSAGKSQAVAAAVKALEKQGMKQLVLDLRHAALTNPAEGVELASLFLEKGSIGSLSGQKVPKKTFQADPAKVVFTGPLVVLTNRGTTGAAEIAAAALQDNKRAQVVGEKTYGDAALRNPIQTEDGGAVLLAVAKYYSPSGKAIQDNSVVPGVAVTDVEPDALEEDDSEQPKKEAAPAKPQEDLILKKGIEVLKGANGTQVAAKSAEVKK
jgi:carboxyl-terminal processing protease